MKASILILMVSASVNSHAKESLFKKPEAPKVSARREIEKSAVPVVAAPNAGSPFRPKGNLDSEILPKSNFYQAVGTHSLLPSGKVERFHPSVKVGETITAIIPEGIVAFADSKLPVRARVYDGFLKGGVFLGEATLEKNSKRILVEFKRFIPKGSRDEYSVSGYAIDAGGLIGLEGKYVTNQGKYFAAEFLSAAAAAFVDASISRSQNAFGNYVESPTADTVGKKAAGAAIGKTTERFAEMARAAPAYSVLQGTTTVRVLIN